MNKEGVVAYLKGVGDLYPDGIPLRRENLPGYFIVPEGTLTDSSKKDLLTSIVVKGMKRSFGDEVLAIEAKEWSPRPAAFFLVFGEIPFLPLKLELGSKALIEGRLALRTFSLEEIASDEGKKRIFWGQLKELLGLLD